MSTAYRVYYAPEGNDPAFCGEYATLAEAQAAAEKEPDGLPQSMWQTAHKAGHCAGMTAPEGGVEGENPISWHGGEGWHCVCAVKY